MPNHQKTLAINRNWCKGCRICVAFCPSNVLELDEEDKVIAPRLSDCTYCKLCELRCPDMAIAVVHAPVSAPVVETEEIHEVSAHHEYN